MFIRDQWMAEGSKRLKSQNKKKNTIDIFDILKFLKEKKARYLIIERQRAMIYFYYAIKNSCMYFFKKREHLLSQSHSHHRT